MADFTIHSLIPPPWTAVQPLIEESQREGFRFLVRLRTEFENGSNCFNAPGEALLGGWHGSDLIAVGGLNRDPYTSESRVGRLRHLYVCPAFRNQGIGQALVEALISIAWPHFSVLQLRTDTQAAALFYERLGFTRMSLPHATHQRVLQGSLGSHPAA